MKYISMCFILLITTFSIQNLIAENLSNNSKSKIILIEYYDYECPHCRNMESVIEALKIKYPQLTVIYRPTPMLTEQSSSIAALVLASEEQNHSLSLHKALMNLSHTPTMEDSLSISQQLGLNTALLLADMHQSQIQNQLKNNVRLAETHAINGGIYLPILTIGQADGSEPSFTLTGEQSYALLSAIIQQIGQNYVQVDKQEQQPRSASFATR